MFNPTKTDMGDLYDSFRAINESMEGTEEVPQTMRPQDDPNIEAEDFNVEDYRDDDLEKVKSKTKEVPEEVSDEDLEQKPLDSEKKKHKTKESREIKEDKSHPLHLCNECDRTFRNVERICLYCDSGDVLPIIPVNEGILELVGEVEGMDQREQDAIRAAVRKGVIDEEWPDEEEMIDALSSLEDVVDPMTEPGDVRVAYLRHIVVPKALSVIEDEDMPVVLKQEGDVKGKFDSINDALTWLHGNVSYSWQEAFKNQGWTLEQAGEKVNMVEAKVEEKGKVTITLNRPIYNIPTSRTFSTEEEAISWTKKVGLLPNQYTISNSTVDEDKVDQVRKMSDQDLSNGISKLMNKAGLNYKIGPEKDMLAAMMDEWKRRAKEQQRDDLPLPNESVDEQEEVPEDHGEEARKAELKAKMAKKEEAHAREMEKMAKELEGMGK